ncbi:hypothetical protein [Nocardioides jiangxiensis]|uniref:Tissue inhibitor of metalloproteinase n=1 Tax=Nocardioides jiangxiensis TaxID=3064524 RepID=A0ABT9B0T5_9ACTN|nr:hypothetical protein [Nocardioides sp. WY-20]MDO7868327.1 hypothetical protein [Nocardioides sp. WY-20]
MRVTERASMVARLRRVAALGGVLVLALGSLVLLSATSAFACSCVRKDTADQARAAAEVFVGTITDTQRAGGGLLARGGGSTDWTVEVDRVWKGDPPAEVTVSSSSQATACGVGELPQARPVLFFVSPSGGGSARQVNICGGTSLLRADLEQQVTAALGQPHAPTTGAPHAGDSRAGSRELSPLRPAWSEIAVTGVLLVGSVGLVAAVLVLAIRVRRRR